MIRGTRTRRPYPWPIGSRVTLDPVTLDPIVHEYEVRCSPEQAFEVYTEWIGDWWHRDYSANPETLSTVTVEPRVGGRVYSTHTAEGDLAWGKVTVWEPGRQFSYASTLAQSREHPSTVTVTFDPIAPGCHVHFEHGGWSAENVHDRRKFTDWPAILDRFARLADESTGR